MPLSWAELVAQWRRPSWWWSSSEDTQVTTWINETNTWKVDEVVNKVENLDVDAWTSIAPVINKVMKLGSVMLRSVGPEIIEPDLPIEDFVKGFKNNIFRTECSNCIIGFWICNIFCQINHNYAISQLRLLPWTAQTADRFHRCIPRKPSARANLITKISWFTRLSLTKLYPPITILYDKAWGG